MSTISAVTSSTDASAYQTTVLPERTMSQKDFFKLLTAQLSAQDPMNPVSNAEFMGQMAQFSTLEQTRTLEQSISKMRSEQQLLQANALIGRAVTVQDGESRIVGTVTGATVEKGVPKLIINNVAYELGQVVEVAPAPVPKT